jgi:hypothetical protein
MGESVVFRDYLVDNYELRAQELMNSGLKIIFTGHFHANDASQITSGELSLTDVETGSPVIYDSPFRIARLENKTLYITTKHVEHIVYPLPKGVTFHNYEKEFSLKGIEIQARYMLMADPYNIPEDMAGQISPLFADTMPAHLAGDNELNRE